MSNPFPAEGRADRWLVRVLRETNIGYEWTKSDGNVEGAHLGPDEVTPVTARRLSQRVGATGAHRIMVFRGVGFDRLRGLDLLPDARKTYPTADHFGVMAQVYAPDDADRWDCYWQATALADAVVYAVRARLTEHDVRDYVPDDNNPSFANWLTKFIDLTLTP